MTAQELDLERFSEALWDKVSDLMTGIGALHGLTEEQLRGSEEPHATQEHLDKVVGTFNELGSMWLDTIFKSRRELLPHLPERRTDYIFKPPTNEPPPLLSGMSDDERQLLASVSKTVARMTGRHEESSEIFRLLERIKP